LLHAKNLLTRVSLFVLLVILAACGDSATPESPETVARRVVDQAGHKDAKITQVVRGDEKYRRADELWCIETDAMFADGVTPYLLAVWRKGSTWENAEFVDGEYQWDLYGCPRS
jgi:hypothetical protein